MSEDTKELLAYCCLLIAFPVFMVANFCSTAILAVWQFSWMQPLAALFVSSVIVGIANGVAVFVISTVLRFVVAIFEKFKGEEE